MGGSNNIITMKHKIKIKRLFIIIITQLGVGLFERAKDEKWNTAKKDRSKKKKKGQIYTFLFLS